MTPLYNHFENLKIPVKPALQCIVLIGITITLHSCYSVKKSVEASLPYSEQINWPTDYEPSKSRFFVHNEIDIQAKPEVIWNILIQAETWPEWYEGAKDVKIKNNAAGILNNSSVFTWNTMGLDFTSTIKEFEPPYRLSWESQRKSIRGYHAWLIIPNGASCTLVTDESQSGWLTFMQKTFIPNKLKKLHDEWLAQIKKKSENE